MTPPDPFVCTTTTFCKDPQDGTATRLVPLSRGMNQASWSELDNNNYKSLRYGSRKLYYVFLLYRLHTESASCIQATSTIFLRVVFEVDVSCTAQILEFEEQSSLSVTSSTQISLKTTSYTLAVYTTKFQKEPYANNTSF